MLMHQKEDKEEKESSKEEEKVEEKKKEKEESTPPKEKRKRKKKSKGEIREKQIKRVTGKHFWPKSQKSIRLRKTVLLPVRVRTIQILNPYLLLRRPLLRPRTPHLKKRKNVKYRQLNCTRKLKN